MIHVDDFLLDAVGVLVGKADLANDQGQVSSASETLAFALLQ